jgi:hypothetical protein
MKITDHDPVKSGRFGPGVFSQDGYLGMDPRGLEEIVQADRRTLEALGTDAVTVAREMKRLRNAARKGLGDDIAVPPVFKVRVETDRGLLVCPYGDSRSVAKTVTTVTDARTGHTMAFTDMNIHLIEKHGFFEGRGAGFRIEPEELCRTLGLDRKER